MKRTVIISALTIIAILTFTTIFACVKAATGPEAEMTYVTEPERPVNTESAGPQKAISNIKSTLGITVTRVEDYQVRGDVYHILLLDKYNQNAVIARVINPTRTDVRFVFMADADEKCAEAQEIGKSYIDGNVAIAPDEELFNKVNSNDFEFAYRQGDKAIDCFMRKQTVCSSVWTIDQTGNISLFWYNEHDPAIAQNYENQ